MSSVRVKLALIVINLKIEPNDRNAQIGFVSGEIIYDLSVTPGQLKLSDEYQKQSRMPTLVVADVLFTRESIASNCIPSKRRLLETINEK